MYYMASAFTLALVSESLASRVLILDRYRLASFYFAARAGRRTSFISRTLCGPIYILKLLPPSATTFKLFMSTCHDLETVDHDKLLKHVTNKSVCLECCRTQKFCAITLLQSVATFPINTL